MLTLLVLVVSIVLAYKSFVFLLSLKLKRNDIADASWGLAFILILLASIFLTGHQGLLITVISLLIFVWGFRLAIRIFLRNIKKSEDYRYAKMREEKNFILKSFLQVYVLQGLLAILVSLPIIFIIYFGKDSSLNWLSYLGLTVWLIGFFFEAVGDLQLDQFIADPNNKGKIIQSGLWKYSRHPNYFGEITLWWGIYLIALSVPFGYLSIFGPAAITFLIIKVSGIPLLEKKYEGNSEFENYKKKTSVLVPLPNRS